MLNLTCKEASRLISQSMDRPLAFRERAALRFHLFICTGCTNFKSQVNALHHICLHVSGRDEDVRR